MLAVPTFATTTIDDFVDNYIKTNGYETPNDIMYAQVDFGKENPKALIVAPFYNNYDKILGYSWNVLELKNNKLMELKTLELSGNIFPHGVVDFDFWFTGNIYLEKYHKKGLLSYYRRGSFWAFTYLDSSDNTLKTINFGKASDVNMTEGQLVKLRDSGTLDIKHKLLN